MTFEQLGLDPSILRALDKQGYSQPTPIQQRAIPILLRRRDLLGCAQTGTGKTAAFAVPIIQLLRLDKTNKGKRKIRALVVTPTRELAIQIADSFSAYAQFTQLRTAVIFGGVKQGNQVKELQRGVDILVATPGRLLDLMDQGFIHLRDINYFVLDEADQMLDMGFIHDIKKLLTQLPKDRQSLFFSATMPTAIINLSKKILGKYEKVTIAPEQSTAERVSQAVYHVSKPNKIKLLIHLLEEEYYFTTLVFSRTKYGADKIVGKLKRAGIHAEAIHGNKSQNARQRTLKAFKEGKTPVLVATDIAARGIDVDDLSLVVNFNLPNVAETYVHRIGRTGRAEASGKSISFCDVDERTDLLSIQRLIKKEIPVIKGHPYEIDEQDKSKIQHKPTKDKRPSGSKNHKKNRRPRNKKRNRRR